MANDLGYVTGVNAVYKDPVTVSKIQQIWDNFSAITLLLSSYKEGVSLNLASVATIEAETGALMINGKLRRNTATGTIGWGNTAGNTIVETSSTGYYIWAFASGTTSTFEYGINQTSANMTGNANARLIGWFWNDTGQTIEGVWYLDQAGNKHYIGYAHILNTTLQVLHHNLNTDKVHFFSQWKYDDGNTDWAIHDSTSKASGDAVFVIGEVTTSTCKILIDGLQSQISGNTIGQQRSGTCRIFGNTL